MTETVQAKADPTAHRQWGGACACSLERRRKKTPHDEKAQIIDNIPIVLYDGDGRLKGMNVTTVRLAKVATVLPCVSLTSL